MSLHEDPLQQQMPHRERYRLTFPEDFSFENANHSACLLKSASDYPEQNRNQYPMRLGRLSFRTPPRKKCGIAKYLGWTILMPCLTVNTLRYILYLPVTLLYRLIIFGHYSVNNLFIVTKFMLNTYIESGWILIFILVNDNYYIITSHYMIYRMHGPVIKLR